MDITEAVCLTLWWTEGTKMRKDTRWRDTFIYVVEVTNTDPEIITLFLNYLRTYLGVHNEKIKVQLQIHEGDNQDNFEKFWSEETGVPRTQFNKTIIRPRGNKVGKSKGTCKIRVYGKSLHLMLLEKLGNLRGVVHR